MYLCVSAAHIHIRLNMLIHVQLSTIARPHRFSVESNFSHYSIPNCKFSLVGFTIYTVLSRCFLSHIYFQTHFVNTHSNSSEGIKHSHRESFYVSETLFILMNLTSQNCTFLRNECYNLKAMSRWRKRVSASLLSFFSLRLSPVNDSSVESVTLARPGQMSPEEMARL